MEFIDVVIPVHNGEAFIGRALESLLQQEMEHWSAIVVNDGSEDRTVDVVESFRDVRIRIIDSDGRGVSAARNTGASAGDAPYIAFLDADDIWYPNKLEVQVDFLIRDSVPAVGAVLDYIDADDHVVGRTFVPSDSDVAAILRKGLGMPLPLSSVLVRRDAFEAIGGFDEELRYAEDVLFFAELSKIGPIGVVRQPLGAYRRHAGNASARHFAELKQSLRYVRRRLDLEARALATPTFEEYAAEYRRSPRQLIGDLGQLSYRRGISAYVSDRRFKALFWFLGAAVMAPGFSFQRLTTRYLRPQRDRCRHDHGTCRVDHDIARLHGFQAPRSSPRGPR